MSMFSIIPLLRLGCGALALAKVKSRPAEVRRVAVVMGGWLGDTFWAAQTLPELAEAFPQAEIYAVIRKGHVPLLNGFLPPERIVAVESFVSDRSREKFRPADFSRAILRVRRLKPDIVVDLMVNQFSALFTLACGAYSVGADLDRHITGHYSFAARRELFPGVHLALRPRAIIRQFIGAPASPEISLRPPRPFYTAEETARRLSLPPGGKIALLVPGAGWAAKRYAPARFRELAARLLEKGFAVAVSVSPAEHALYAGIAAGRENVIREISDLRLILSLLPLCAVCVGNDSGIVHVAAAAGIPCVALFCQTNPEYCAPRGGRVKVLRADCPLTPTATHFCCGEPRLTCDHPECMDISVDAVSAAIDELV